jgi:transglutaminase/protease-like cytokinesis protein 3
MTRLLLNILILLPLSIFAQIKDFESVDDFVQSQQFEENTSIAKLTIELTKTYDEEILKVRAIYDWIASNIDYDTEGYENNFWTHYPSDMAILNDTYKLRKGVCSGYSHLFKYMLELCDIESEVISGFSRTGLDNFFPHKANHDWNAIKIDNEWKLFDVTWAREKGDTILDYFWFDTKPDDFILWHFPQNESWLLTDKDYSLQDFYNFPVYSKLLYQTDFISGFSKKGYFVAIDNTIRIDLKPNFNCFMITKIYNLETQEWENPEMTDRTKESGYFKILLKDKGKYILKLSVGRNLENGFVIYNDLILYTIENK